jgi:hypothetical protein
MMAVTAFADDIKVDYDHTANFSRYKTFMWVRQPNIADPLANPLMKQRIMDAVNRQLEAKGLRLVNSNADLGVSANQATTEQHTLEGFYDGFPDWGWHRWWWGPDTIYVDTFEIGTIVVDLFDTNTKQVVWWGSVSKTLSDKPSHNTKKMYSAIGKLFREFPPYTVERATD